jgi:hypothetical protein
MKKQKPNQTEAAPNTAQQVTSDNNSEPKPIMFVVVRDGLRVSDKEYIMAEDPAAIHERDFWKTIATKHSYGEPVEIVKYDSKKHRVW